MDSLTSLGADDENYTIVEPDPVSDGFVVVAVHVVTCMSAESGWQPRRLTTARVHVCGRGGGDGRAIRHALHQEKCPGGRYEL